MSIKVTLVEDHINRNFKQYNIDDFTIKQNFKLLIKFYSIHQSFTRLKNLFFQN